MYTTVEQKGQVGEFLFFSALPGADYLSVPGPTLSFPLESSFTFGIASSGNRLFHF